MRAVLEGRSLTLAGRLAATDLRLYAGELVCLIGPNGSGKTSLLHALAGIAGAGGEVFVEGKALKPSDRPRTIGYLSAARDIGWPMRARDVIALGLARRNEEAIDRVVEEHSLQTLQHRRVDRLSTGERTRVLAARALVTRPPVLLLDEPTANLDPLWQLRMMDVFRARVRNGAAALVALHDLAIARAYADRLLVMAGGRIVAEGTPAEVMESATFNEVFGIRADDSGAWRIA